MDTNHLMGRRQFLIASSTCAIATAAVGPKLFAADAAAPNRLAVGFAPIEENPFAAAASRLSAADAQFIRRGARISVSGASGAPADPRARRAVDLLAHYSYADGSERRTAPFRAWACSRTTGCQGSPTRFTFPLEDERKIVFTVETERGKPAAGVSRRDALIGSGTESTVLPVTLTLGNEAGAVKLARGFYIIVPMFEGESEPRWRAYTLRTADGRLALHDRDGKVAPFEHFVLRVDYAMA